MKATTTTTQKIKVELFSNRNMNVTSSQGMFEIEIKGDKARAFNNCLFGAPAGNVASRFNPLFTSGSYPDFQIKSFVVNGTRVWFKLVK